MSSKLLINVNDASIVVPDTGDDTPSGAGTPDTGGNTILAGTNYANDNGTSMVLPILGISLLVLLIIAAIITTTVRRHKTNKAGNFSINNTKRLITKVTTLSAVVLLAILATVNLNNKQEQVEATANTDELTITTSDIEIDVDLNDKAVFATGESVITVDSATEAGYTLMAYVDSTTTDLKNETNKSSKSTIAMLDANLKTPKGLEDNTWGMSATRPTSQQDEVFRGLPTTLDEAVTLKYTEEATIANDKTTVYYGTYITPDLDYGTYSGVTITYVAVANFYCNPNATTIQEAKCLQDFAGPNRDQIVDSMTPETQYTLADMRDEKTYTIAKFYTYALDGSGFRPIQEPETAFQVWMTQNLDLDLDSSTTYTNEDTDLGYNPDTDKYETATWTPLRSTYAATSTHTHEWCVGGDWENNSCYSNYTPESYDAGDLYWNARPSDSDEWYDYYSGCNHSTSNPDCSHSVNPLPNYVSSTGTPQYHLGNYYNWAATVAVNDSSPYTDGEDDMKRSICPAGWTLPSMVTEDFARLWNWYDFSESSINDSGALWTSPLYFVPGGFFSGALTDVGSDGGFWSSTPYSYRQALGAYFGTNGYVEPESCAGNECGHTVRCVVRSAAGSSPVNPA